MQIELKNLDTVEGALTVKGPQVEVTLGDAGQANVTIALSLSDGTHFFYPDGSGKVLNATTTLPPGDYDCVVVVNAMHLDVFGTTYRSKVTIGGITVATAQGSVAAGQKSEQDFQIFRLIVR